MLSLLSNPRYTGHQVWNKQSKSERLLDVHNVGLGTRTVLRWNPDEKWVYSQQAAHPAIMSAADFRAAQTTQGATVLVDVNDVALGYTTKLRWNDKDQWVVSDNLVHDPLVSDEDFEHVQRLLEVKGRRAVVRRPRTTGRVYPLRSRLHCGLCNRRMQGSWNNDQPYYRCTFASEYAMANHVEHPKSVYLREADVLPVLDDWLAKLFDPVRREATIRLLAESQQQDDRDDAKRQGAEEKIAECDTKLARYRAALEAGTDAATVAEWIREVQADRALAEAQLAERKDAPNHLGEDETAAHLDTLGDVSTVFRQADRKAITELYAGLDLRLTYHPVERKVRAEANLNSHDM
ncbi:hypothetical protein GCM10023224_08760 [Streptomonospora halophila]|uniref:Recombinase zinc beta ribbon domain-containing protein n=1 Tax=Streptomonospora halophila TaxID=427369 RepID=A0ABP9G7Z1_9ACTN